MGKPKIELMHHKTCNDSYKTAGIAQIFNGKWLAEIAFSWDGCLSPSLGDDYILYKMSLQQATSLWISTLYTWASPFAHAP